MPKIGKFRAKDDGLIIGVSPQAKDAATGAIVRRLVRERTSVALEAKQTAAAATESGVNSDDPSTHS